MIELIFTACLRANIQHCEEKSLLYGDISTMNCLMGAQPELAKWIETHPHWTISKWKCQYLNVAEKEI